MNQLSRHKLGLSHRLACTFLLSAHKRFVSFFLSLLSSLKHKKKQKRPTKRTYFCVCIKERENLENRDAVARCQKSTHTESTHTHAALASSNNGEKGGKGGVEKFFFSLFSSLSLFSLLFVQFATPKWPLGSCSQSRDWVIIQSDTHTAVAAASFPSSSSLVLLLFNGQHG